MRHDRLSPTRDRRWFIEAIPDLIVEVISPEDRPVHVARNVHTYLGACVPLVLLVDPDRRTIDVYRPSRPVQTLTGNDEFDGGDVLPGFSFRVGDIFPSGQ